MAKDVPETFSMDFPAVIVESESEKKVIDAVTVEIDCGLMTIGMSKKVGRAYAKVKARLGDVARFPMNPGESVKDWELRIQPEKDAADVIRRKNESAEDHAIRLETPKQVGIDIYVDLLNEVCDLLKQPKISHESFENVLINEAFDFMFRIMKEARVPAVEYFPLR